jgi:hypothetical protein
MMTVEGVIKLCRQSSCIIKAVVVSCAAAWDSWALFMLHGGTACSRGGGRDLETRHTHDCGGLPLLPSVWRSRALRTVITARMQEQLEV